jgi:ATP-binding cassette subfamily F protein uup
MPLPPLISIQEAHITFDKKPLFEDLSFNVHQGSKVCIIGKNGAGKSTLMHMIAGTQELDWGKRVELPGITIGYLTQDIKFDPQQKVYDYLFSGLADKSKVDDNTYLIDIIAAPLKINIEDFMGNLSGGQLRRTALAHSLIENPDLLLLDEPTNHLDFEAVEWLENYLRSYRGTILCISHDRTFLKNISDKVFWLDRGKIKICPKGYAHFDTWSQELLDQEKRELNNRQKTLDIEMEWVNKGVKARRKRNVQRLSKAYTERSTLKTDKTAYHQTVKKLEIKPIKVIDTSKIITEFIKVSKKFNDKIILDQFSLKVVRGDKIGILGKNGSGKTSFLRMILGDLAPDTGKIKFSKTIKMSYFDQKRSDLKLNETIKENLCPNGGDYIDVTGKLRHICGYLKDFLFDPNQVFEPVKILSGGQKNRLMLAKVLANPGNCLILDEPTNDLDMDTLDILEEILSQYKGTLFIVSHDRNFLDQTVNKIIAFEGDGVVNTYVGNYSDYEVQSIKPQIIKTFQNKKVQISNNLQKPKKLSYKEKFELDNLPKNIEKLTKELEELNKKFEDPNYFNSNELRAKSLKRLSELSIEIEAAEIRWLELDEMKAE